jgi:hypothetical protein
VSSSDVFHLQILCRAKINKGIGVDNIHYLNDGLWKVRLHSCYNSLAYPLCLQEESADSANLLSFEYLRIVSALPLVQQLSRGCTSGRDCGAAIFSYRFLFVSISLAYPFQDAS